MRRAALVCAAAVAACFGAGPTPPPPTDATIVFSVASNTDPNGCLGYYIGDVAIGSDAGYAITVPYKPQSCSGGGSISQGQAQPVFRFAKSGVGSSMIGSAGPASTNSEPKIAVDDAGPAWAYPMAQGNALQIDPGGLSIDFGSTAGPTFAVAALVGVGSTLYLAAAPAIGSTTPNDPSYPCCGGMQGGGGTAGAVQTSPSSMLHVAPILACSATSHCLAVTTDNVYYFDQPVGTTGATSAVEQAPKAGATPTKLGDIGGSVGLTSPVGIAADDTTVVWATSVTFLNVSSNLPRGCELSMSRGGVTTRLFATMQFSCSDVALDGTHAYFTIVSIIGNDSNNQSMHGDGIGRVELATGDVESLALGIRGTQSGPRRVYADGGDLYLVDPEVIGKIAKAALDGQHDVGF